ncbi:interleukin-8-like [Pseudophryne corroboree]|uniref:interleukin-8-like n=1 Tax=Pseudophryne corroboree TaxID=495146 RepID=UPI003081DAA8
MFTKTFSAAVVIILLYITASEAMTLARTVSELRCQCIKLDSRQISTKLMNSVELIPSGPHCKNVEVIITLKSGDLVCVDPSASWVQRIIRKIIESQENKQEASSVSQQ